MSQTQQSTSQWYRILLLILAGESIFILPFVLARIFRPTVLDVFQLNNFQLGTCFSVCGTVSLLSYLYGGAIADKYQPRKLIAGGLFLTALGGLYLATYPSFTGMKVLWGYWGFTTIFLFWGAMIKATREWGGENRQGKAFGFLEGGRGMVAASMGAVGVLIFALFLPENMESASLAERQHAFRYVILFTSGLVAFIGFLVWFFMKDEIVAKNSETRSVHPLKNIAEVLKYKSVWLLMIIVLCGYVGYKLTDIFSLYAAEIMGMSEVNAAKIGTFQLYLRPIVCVSVGLLADRTRAALWLMIGFGITLIGALIFASGIVTEGIFLLFVLSMVLSASGTYAVRTMYFAALKEGVIPLAVTGAAVGAISVVGYTPDIFVGPIMGYLLDNSPGIWGHQQVFIMLLIFSLIGFLTAVYFNFYTLKRNSK